MAQLTSSEIRTALRTVSKWRRKGSVISRTYVFKDFVAATAKVNVLPAGAITRGLRGEEITEFGLLKEAGAVCLSDGRRSIQSAGLMRAAMSYAANFDLLIAHYAAEDARRGRNDPCTCSSGKKWKQCHGA